MTRQRGAGDGVEIEGVVVSGHGIGHQHIGTKCGPEIEAAIGGPVYPGTLNLLLKTPLRIARHNAHDFRAGRRYLCPAMVQDVPVWIHRWPYIPLHVGELISEFRLRDRLGVEDGDIVTLRIAPREIDPVSLVSRLAWALCWRYREKYYYSRQGYANSRTLNRIQRYTRAIQWA